MSLLEVPVFSGVSDLKEATIIFSLVVLPSTINYLQNRRSRKTVVDQTTSVKKVLTENNGGSSVKDQFDKLSKQVKNNFDRIDNRLTSQDLRTEILSSRVEKAVSNTEQLDEKFSDIDAKVDSLDVNIINIHNNVQSHLEYAQQFDENTRSEIASLKDKLNETQQD